MQTGKTDYKTLRDLCQRIVMATGVPEADAFTVADSLVDADLCGIESHGVSRMPCYVKRLKTGVVSAETATLVEAEYPSALVINGGNSMGMVSGAFAMRRCIEKARENGSCFATVSHSNHYGTAGYFVRMAAEAGMFGLSATNAPPNIAPWGSPQKYMGTNPIAMAVPGPNEPIFLDMAPSIVAMGKIIMAAKLGQSIPEGWVLDPDGNPTTDPVVGQHGTLLPIGGPKGSGLAIFMEILCGVLAGAEVGPHLNHFWNDFENPQNVGHIFLAVDISKFLPLDAFRAQVEGIVGEMKALPKNPGTDEIMMPGEPELRRRTQRMEQGIDLPESVRGELKALAEEAGVPFTL